MDEKEKNATILKHGWILDREKWKELSSATTDCKWRNVDFSDVFSPNVPQESGMYLICGRVPECSLKMKDIKLNNILYVGISKNLKRRFKEHITDSNENSKIKKLKESFRIELRFWYTLIKDEDMLNDIENIFIDCFWPSANTKRRTSVKKCSNIYANIGTPKPA